MRIAVIGTGYVGLVSGTCFAELGLHVTCIDKDSDKIEALRAGKVTIFEPGLDDLVIKNSKAGRLEFSNQIVEAIEGAEVIFIAVGTPTDEETGGADLTAVFNVVETLAPHLQDGVVLATKSTVPVGTGRQIQGKIRTLRPELTCHIVSNPEFLREGSAVKDFLAPDRIVVGADTEHAKEIMSLLYAPLVEQEVPIVCTDIPTAELIKYASNAFLATKIAFLNEMADICQKVDATIDDVAVAMGLDHRIGKDYLHPGPGFGGSCFPKDTLALHKIGSDIDAKSEIVEAVIRANESRKHDMAAYILDALGDAKDKTLAILGLAFKANTDDMRASPALTIIPELLAKEVTIRAYDPEAMEQAKALLQSDVTWCDSMDACIADVDAVVIVTEWDEFKDMDLAHVKAAMAAPVIIDLRNIFAPTRMQAAGFTYYSIGRPTVR